MSEHIHSAVSSSNTLPPSELSRAGAAQHLHAAIFQKDVAALDWLWSATHPKLRDRVRAVVGHRPAGAIEATSVLASVYRVQRERPKRVRQPKPFLTNRLVRGPFDWAGVDLERFREDPGLLDDARAIEIFQAIVVNDVRSYLADRSSSFGSAVRTEACARWRPGDSIQPDEVVGLLDQVDGLEPPLQNIVVCVLGLDMDETEVAAVHRRSVEWVRTCYALALSKLREQWEQGRTHR